MLKKENIDTLLKINTENNDNRYLRIMSCDNPIKQLYVFYLNDIKREFKNELDNKFDSQILMCTYKFYSTLYEYLNDNTKSINVTNCCFKIDNNIIQNAMTEIFNFHTLLAAIFSKGTFHEEIANELFSYKISNYIVILQFLNLVDINNCTNSSKILSRFYNIKEQLNNYYDDKMDRLILIKEINEHTKYFSKQIAFIREYNLLKAEDFLLYILLFDIKHNKNTKVKEFLFD